MILPSPVPASADAEFICILDFFTPPLIGKSLGLVSVLRLKVPRLLVSSRSRTKFWRLSCLGLVSDEKFSDSLVSVSSRLLQFFSVPNLTLLA